MSTRRSTLDVRAFPAVAAASVEQSTIDHYGFNVDAIHSDANSELSYLWPSPVIGGGGIIFLPCGFCLLSIYLSIYLSFFIA